MSELLGHLARSIAGHDAGTIYVVTGEPEGRLALCDGRKRTRTRPKIKNRRHVQILNACLDPETAASDLRIKKALKEFKKEGMDV